MERVFVLGGIVFFALCLFLLFLVFKKKAKKPSFDAGVVTPMSPSSGMFKPREFPGKKSFNFSFRPPTPIKTDSVKVKEGPLDRNPVLPRVTMPSPLVPQPAVPLPPVPKDSMADDKLVLKDNEIHQLQEEMKTVREKADEQIRHALETLKKLHEENDRLLSDVDRLRGEAAKPRGDADVLDRLHEENIELKIQLEAAVQGQKEFEEQIQAVRQEFDGQLARANETIAHLEKENQGLRPSSQDLSDQEKAIDVLREEHQQQISEFRREIDSLQRDNEALKAAQASQGAKQENVLSEDRVRDLEQANNSLEEKNKFLQYELTKSRAQAAGFERICEGSKKRLEDMGSDIRSLENEKESLRRKAEELEKSLEFLKKTSPGLIDPKNGS